MARTVTRSEVRAALEQRLAKISVNRLATAKRLSDAAAAKVVPLPVLLGKDVAKRLVDDVMDELKKQLGTSETIVILD